MMDQINNSEQYQQQLQNESEQLYCNLCSVNITTSIQEHSITNSHLRSQNKLVYQFAQLEKLVKYHLNRGFWDLQEYKDYLNESWADSDMRAFAQIICIRCNLTYKISESISQKFLKELANLLTHCYRNSIPIITTKVIDDYVNQCSDFNLKFYLRLQDLNIVQLQPTSLFVNFHKRQRSQKKERILNNQIQSNMLFQMFQKYVSQISIQLSIGLSILKFSSYDLLTIFQLRRSDLMIHEDSYVLRLEENAQLYFNQNQIKYLNGLEKACFLLSEFDDADSFESDFEKIKLLAIDSFARQNIDVYQLKGLTLKNIKIVKEETIKKSNSKEKLLSSEIKGTPNDYGFILKKQTSRVCSSKK